MTAAHPPSAALAAGSELTSSNHAIKIDAELLVRSFGQHVLPEEAEQGSARLLASFSLPSLHFPCPRSTVSQPVMSDWYRKCPLHRNEIMRKKHLPSGS